MPNFEAPAEYLRANYERDDRLAVVLIYRETGIPKHEFATAEKIATPRYQAHLRAANASGADIYLTVNALKPEATGRTKGDGAAARGSAASGSCNVLGGTIQKGVHVERQPYSLNGRNVSNLPAIPTGRHLLSREAQRRQAVTLPPPGKHNAKRLTATCPDLRGKVRLAGASHQELIALRCTRASYGQHHARRVFSAAEETGAAHSPKA